MAVTMEDEASLHRRLRSTEDAFVERKTIGDDKDDWLKTAVAFANTAPIDYPCVLYIGVRNDGEIEEKTTNFDKLQKTFAKVVSTAYPPIPYLTRIIQSEGKEALAVVIWGSAVRPHFSGKAYVRDGSTNVEATEEQYQRFIAERSSIVRKLLSYKNKPVRVLTRYRDPKLDRDDYQDWGGNPIIDDCDQFYVTFKMGSMLRSVPLGRIELSYDHNRNTLQVSVGLES